MGHDAKKLVAALEKQDAPPPYSYTSSSQYTNNAPNHRNNTYNLVGPSRPPAIPSNRPIKTFSIVNTGFWTTNHLVLTLENKPILWAITKSSHLGLGTPVLSLYGDPQGRVVLAAAKCKNWSSGVKVCVGPADSAPWQEVASESWSDKQYGFWFGGRKFLWRRTHDKSLGGSRWSSKDFKLLDAANESQVLAVYVQDKRFFSGSQVGRIDFMVELGQDLELMSLAAILGIEEQIQRTEGAAAGAGGGGGA